MPLFQHPNFLKFHLQQQSRLARLQHLSITSLRRLRQSFTVASSTASSWSSHLQSVLASAAAPTPAAPPASATAQLTQAVYDLFEAHSTASYTTVGATLLACIFLLARYLMSSYRDGFYESRGGRRSPYTSFLQSRTSNLSDYVEYLAGNEMYTIPDSRYEKDYHRHSVARPHQHNQYESDDAPDVLLLRYKGLPYELLFVPYAISDGKLYIQDIKHFAAEKLGVDPRRLRLLYKRRELMEDSWQAREYGLKQNSEITCVVVDPSAVGSGDSGSDSDDDSGSAVSTSRGHLRKPNQRTRRPRPRGMSTARHRTEADTPPAASVPTDYLYPHSAGAGVARQSRPAERSSGDSLNIPNGYDRHERVPSRSRQPSPAPPHHQPAYAQPSQSKPGPQRTSPPPSSIPSNIDPASSLGKISALINTFNTTWLPMCQHFISSPPTDTNARDKEYKRLSETVLAQIVLKADDIDTGGDPECRRLRKQLIGDANDIMKKLDGVAKR